MVLHAHREGHLLFKLDGSSATCVVDGRPYAIDGRKAAAVSPWQPHRFMPNDAEPGTCCLILYVDPMRFSETGGPSTSPLRFGGPKIQVTAGVRRLVDDVASRLLSGAPDDRALAADIFALTELCFEQSWHRPAPAIGAGGPDQRGTDYRIRNSISLMRSRLGDELVLDRIARDAGLSRPHFFKLFRRSVGLTPNLYLNILKTERSVRLLTTTDEPVTSIGFDLGFASQASFTRFFIANVGIAPSDYRRATLPLG
ncbi:MAG: AraC family transcriptional regulator [Hyphomicrobiaceae bacterium]